MQTEQNQQITPATTLNDIQSLENFQKTHADKFTRAQLLWFLRNRDRNGLGKTGAVILSARKFYINTPVFTTWFANQKA